MKLKNKLIPLISLAATATAIAPLATSCGNVVIDGAEAVDVLHGYLPDIARASERNDLSEEDAKDLYIDHIKNNPEIFAQDLYWWEGLAIKYRLFNACYGLNYNSGTATPIDDGSFISDLYYLYGLYPAAGWEYKEYSFNMLPHVAKFNVSNISFGEVKLTNPNTQKEEKISTISMKMSAECEYELNADCVHGSDRYMAQRIINVNLESEYKNIPFTIMWDTEYATWRVMPTGWYKVPAYDSTWILQRHQNWSYNFNNTCISTDTIKDYNGSSDTYTYDESQGALIDTYAKVKNWVPTGYSDAEAKLRSLIFNFGSYHLYDILGPKWAYSNLGNGLQQYVAFSKETNPNIVYADMYSTFARSWSKEDERLETAPAINNSWSLNSDVVLPQPLYKYDETNKKWKDVGTISFLKADNSNKNWYQASSYRSATIDLRANLVFTNEEDIPTDLEDLRDSSKFYFNIPEDTTFKFDFTYLNGESALEEVKVDHNIKCFWVSTDTEIA